VTARPGGAVLGSGQHSSAPPVRPPAPRPYLGAQYRRLAARRGAKRAFVAVGHTILGIFYAVLTSGRPFDDLGVTYFDRRDAEHVRRRLTRRLEALGYVVTVAPRVASRLCWKSADGSGSSARQDTVLVWS